MFTLEDLDRVEPIVRRHVPPTPQYAWPLLADASGTETWVKHENHTPTGAFKMRGGLGVRRTARARAPGVAGIVDRARGQPRSEHRVRRAAHGVP